MENIAQWQDSYNTGRELIDSQHKALFNEINACLAATRNHVQPTQLLSMLEDIESGLKGHFAYEEQLVKELGLNVYPQQTQHDYALEHLSKGIAEIKDYLKYGANDQIGEKKKSSNKSISFQHILISLYEWYVNHLETTDVPLLRSTLK